MQKNERKIIGYQLPAKSPIEFKDNKSGFLILVDTIGAQKILRAGIIQLLDRDNLLLQSW